MRSAPSLAAAALAAAFLLTACSDDGSGGDTDSGKGGTTACKIDEVAVEVGPAAEAPAAGDTGSVPVTITNGATKCTLDGLPAVEIQADGTSAAVPADPAAKAQKLTLAKDQAISFTITYVRGESGDAKSLAAKTAKFSLPGSTATHSFPWSYGDVALKGGAGEPDATVSGFQQVGD
ncbi:DUF4232 domain-containing protein [Streptomyces resistomycificus]|uniref:DUF4232 domain-containing protein n=1 Tax=Streptomyces resistomycificus TaxID=67356 RepID=A0A0L8LBH8_9ACTN|nr:DUF4232 domain-containing protein [Streptomyces resistomycificus]KOG35386.1 hypothetical protein ADK37_15130 [Streptomyces resistomycificus]KUN98370.1 hypothetical protein AQJ84_15005 [Streptomyces resistomycificus]